MADSISDAFNVFIANGLAPMMAAVEEAFHRDEDALKIAPEIMQFLLSHPVARRAIAFNFPADSSACKVLLVRDTFGRADDDTDEETSEGADGPSCAESELFDSLGMRMDAEDGIDRKTASKMLSFYQEKVTSLA